jgi:hypothetical protein
MVYTNIIGKIVESNFLNFIYSKTQILHIFYTN